MKRVIFCSPVSGEVIDIVRGDKRKKYLEVVIKADSEISYEEFTTATSNNLSREQIIEDYVKSWYLAICSTKTV